MSWFRRDRAATSAAPVANRPAGDLALFQGRYRLGARLGSGAGAVVHEALDLRTGGTVAVKLIQLPADLSEPLRQEWTSRLRQEAEIARRVAHPDIVAVHEAGVQGSQAWLVMERIQGVDLSRYAQPQRLLPETLVLRIGARVAWALAHAHAQGVVHRDLKPANVLVNVATGQVKLADFGVAHDQQAEPTRTGLQLGTPAYMAPELLAGARPSAASDTYALGVMLFELLTGRRPHEADSLGALLQATRHDPPASLAALRPDLPVSVASALQLLLQRAPEARPRDLDAWAAQLAGLAAVMARVQAPSPSPGR